MKISDIITAGLPSFFQSDSSISITNRLCLTNRDVLSYLEYLMAAADRNISRNDAAIAVAKHIESFQIPNTRKLYNMSQ